MLSISQKRLLQVLNLPRVLDTGKELTPNSLSGVFVIFRAADREFYIVFNSSVSLYHDGYPDGFQITMEIRRLLNSRDTDSGDILTMEYSSNTGSWWCNGQRETLTIALDLGSPNGI